MKLFRTSPPKKVNEITSEGIFLGSPEAEAESMYNSSVNLSIVFEDYLRVFPKLEKERFIISGRKGSGKTAIAEFLLNNSQNDPNLFCAFVKKGDIDIHKILQQGALAGHEIEGKLLLEWIILVKLTYLIVQNYSIYNTNEFENLRLFLKRNTGLVDIKDYEIVEQIKEKGFDVHIEYFRRFFNFKSGRKLKIKEERAPFYRLLAPLRETLTSLLEIEKNSQSENNYVLVFDDLDIGIQASDHEAVKNISDLIRLLRDYNVEVFGKKGYNTKIIALLREDIKKLCKDNFADTAKIFSSYDIPLIWHEPDVARISENDLLLKKFISKRIDFNLKEKNIPIKETSWSTLVDENNYLNANKSAFKYILDHTFYRPRDLLLFFLPLPDKYFLLPISPDDLQKLIIPFSRELVSEIKNELILHYNVDEVRTIFKVIENLSHRSLNRHLNLSDFDSQLKTEQSSLDTSKLLDDMYDYSIIGNIDPTNNHVFFKHRQPLDEIQSFDPEQQILIHQTISTNFTKRIKRI